MLRHSTHSSQTSNVSFDGVRGEFSFGDDCDVFIVVRVVVRVLLLGNGVLTQCFELFHQCFAAGAAIEYFFGRQTYKKTFKIA